MGGSFGTLSGLKKWVITKVPAFFNRELFRDCLHII